MIQNAWLCDPVPITPWVMYISILSSGQVPTSTYTVQTLLDNTDVGQPLYKIVRHIDEFKDWVEHYIWASCYSLY